MRRGARVVESGSLENCCTLTGTVGSNPTLSATPISDLRFRIYKTRVSDGNPFFFEKFNFRGKMQEWLNWQHWKCCEPQKGSVGSNPTLSAISISDCGFGISDFVKVSPKSPIPNRHMASGSAQGLSCEPR